MPHTPQPMPYTYAKHLLSPVRRLMQSPRKIVRRLGLEPTHQVLELGPGPGFFSIELAKSVPEGKLILVDVQREMLDMTRERLEQAGLKNIEYHQGDAVHLPVRSASVDAVFVVSVLGEVPDRAKCLSEIHRVLRPGGLLSITELKVFDPDCVPFPELEASVQQSGFQKQSHSRGVLQHTVHFRKLP